MKVGVGTDSVVTGNPLDLFAESRLAATACPMSPRDQLRLVTADAADALGVTGAGRIEPGAWADLTAVALRGRGVGAFDDPEGAIAGGADAAGVRATWVAGRCVYRAGEWPGVDLDREKDAIAHAERAAVEAARVLAAEGAGRISS